MEFTQEESAAMRAEYGKGATDTQWELFLSECKARNLRPGVHLVFQLRNAKEYDPTVGASVFVKKSYWITTISALRLIAQRTGEYMGQAPEEYVYLDPAGMPNLTSNVPLPDPDDKQVPREPWVVKTKVYRKGFTEPMVGIARFEAYAATQKFGDKVRLTDMWVKRGSEQLAKCSEALALRKAFPEEMGSLFIAEELKHEEPETPQADPTPLAAAPVAAVVPKVNQTPAEPTDAPRPNESGKDLKLVDVVLGRDPAAVIAEPVQKLETPAEKPKRTRKPKETPAAGELSITDEDIALAQDPENRESSEAAAERARSSHEFVEDVSGETPVPDRIPTPEQSSSYVKRVREMVKVHGVDNKLLGQYVYSQSGKQSIKEFTVGDWDKAFEKLDAATVAGTLKELVKPNAA